MLTPAPCLVSLLVWCAQLVVWSRGVLVVVQLVAWWWLSRQSSWCAHGLAVTVLPGFYRGSKWLRVGRGKSLPV
ncbi:hypothetical protein JWJ90_13650 [Desulfobulbus rhabdoformis]|uniref:hypothetical protein n=1 Tax=Desulfobulbus rhabdoformis TaxID=34032 RepID=UPI0019646D9F|nr:hypothetical protein [Desulfobulbus rhabdoformis]MBM9615324.1 hypothetical protein [Desulfobulbus rhabdoformis]